MFVTSQTTDNLCQLAMNSLPPEIMGEIFVRIGDLKSANEFRLTSRYFNGIYLKNRRYLSRVDSGLFIIFTDTGAYLANTERKWPRIKLVPNPKGPDNAAIEQFDLLNIVGHTNKTDIVYETSELASSLEKIFTNIKLYCRLDIVIEDRVRPIKFFDMLMIAYDAFDSLLEAKIRICRKRRAAILWKEDIIRKIRNELPDFHLRSNPWRFKSALGQEDRPQLIEFLNGFDGLTPALSDHRTGVRVIDEHLGRLKIWKYVDGTKVLLAQDEVIVLNDSHFTDELLNLNLIGSSDDGPIPLWKNFLLFVLAFLQMLCPSLFEWTIYCIGR